MPTRARCSFDALGRLIQGGDGGALFPYQPQRQRRVERAQQLDAIAERALRDGLQPISKRLVMSSQDTGTAYQSVPGSTLYNAIGVGGDGDNAAVNDTTLREQDQSVLYMSSQNWLR